MGTYQYVLGKGLAGRKTAQTGSLRLDIPTDIHISHRHDVEDQKNQSDLEIPEKMSIWVRGFGGFGPIMPPFCDILQTAWNPLTPECPGHSNTSGIDCDFLI